MKREHLLNWVEGLTKEELRYVCMSTVSYLIETEDVHLPNDIEYSPYWDTNGERLEVNPNDERESDDI